MDKHDLPFKVGQLAEARSFSRGYRGAWFRCEINEIGWKKYGLGYALKYYDFPDEKVRWTKAYNKRNSKESELQLMVRPCFPPVYRESELPDINSISEVIVIVNDVWKVGDLVDWWKDNCYWSGKLTKVLGNERLRIELFPPPIGEGSPYEVSCKDLRPSLDWSAEHGWTVPMSRGSENYHSCARLIKPGNQGGIKKLMVHAVDEGRKDFWATAEASVQHNDLFSSDILASSLRPLDRLDKTEPMPLSNTTSKVTQAPEIDMELDGADNGIGKANCSDNVPSLHGINASVDLAGNTGGKDRPHDNYPSKKMRTDESISLNTMCSDAVEAAILDLEELVNRVKWIKGILEFGNPLSNTSIMSWKFLEHRASSMPK